MTGGKILTAKGTKFFAKDAKGCCQGITAACCLLQNTDQVKRPPDSYLMSPACTHTTHGQTWPGTNK
jgi:hypothetical protein